MEDVVDSTAAAITLKCADGRLVVIKRAHVQRCPLLQSLPSLPNEIAVPFSESEMQTWLKHVNYVSHLHDVEFLDCLSIIQVADFLQDQDMVEAAARAANTSLMKPIKSRKRKFALGVAPCKDTPRLHLTALQALPPNLIQVVLKAGGTLHDWIEVLPKSCIPIMVAAAVDAGKLRLSLKEKVSDRLNLILTAAMPLATISRLEVVYHQGPMLDISIIDEMERLSLMTQLKSLTIWNTKPPAQLAQLTSLTHLSLGRKEWWVAWRRLTVNVSLFPDLQDLSLVGLDIHDFGSFQTQLRTLTKLTALELCTDMNRSDTGPEEMCQALATALTALQSLVKLTILFPESLMVREKTPEPDGGDAPDDGEGEESPPHVPVFVLPNCIIQAFPTLVHLTFLDFAGAVDCEIECGELQAAWTNMPALRELRIDSEMCWEDYLHTFKCLHGLERFHLVVEETEYREGKYGLGASCGSMDSSGSIPCVPDDIASQIPFHLPTSLTSLKLECPLSLMPSLGCLSKLQSIELNGCLRWCEDGLPPCISKLTGLKTFSTGLPLRECWDEAGQDDDYDRDLGMLLSNLPTTLCELRLPEQTLSEFSMICIPRLSNLTYLDIGKVAWKDTLLLCGTIASKLLDLRRLRIRCMLRALSYENAVEVVSNLNQLPYFEQLDHGPDTGRHGDDGFWASVASHDVNFELVAECSQ